jgi:hypothetical protein
MAPACSASLHRMAARAKNKTIFVWLAQVKQLVGFQPNFTDDHYHL